MNFWEWMWSAETGSSLGAVAVAALLGLLGATGSAVVAARLTALKASKDAEKQLQSTLQIAKEDREYSRQLAKRDSLEKAVSVFINAIEDPMVELDTFVRADGTHMSEGVRRGAHQMMSVLDDAKLNEHVEELMWDAQEILRLFQVTYGTLSQAMGHGVGAMARVAARVPYSLFREKDQDADWELAQDVRNQSLLEANAALRSIANWMRSLLREWPAVDVAHREYPGLAERINDSRAYFLDVWDRRSDG